MKQITIGICVYVQSYIDVSVGAVERTFAKWVDVHHALWRNG